VLSLLAADEKTGEFASTQASGWVGAARSPRQASQAAGGDSAASIALLGTVIEGKYRVDAVLGSGGMGTVYRARQLRLQRTVALKLMRADMVTDAAALARFEREALAVARLKHPHIVAIYDFGNAPDVGAYIVMEYVEGRSLREELRGRARLPVVEAFVLVLQVCSAVHAAHTAGVIHRDLKPENIVLEQTSEGASAKVLDFGIALLEDAIGVERVSACGAIIGTPMYMSPEQCRGEELDARSDVYALGCVLYEMITGGPPFVAASAVGVMAQHLAAEAEPPSRRAEGIGSGLDAVLLRALAKCREDRYASAADLRRALEDAGAERGAGHVSERAGRRAGKEPARSVEAGTLALGGEVQRDAGPNNLPHPLTRFIGRQAQIEEVKQRLETARLVTLTGVGGIGKTRLAVEVARAALADYPDGAWLAEFAPLVDPLLVSKTVAVVFGIQEESGRAIEEALVERLKHRRALLVLDNCEHLVDACARLVDGLLRACPELRVVATSREPLRVDGEALWSVPSLSVPDAQQPPPAERLTEYEATALLLDRAVLANPTFTATERNRGAILELCRQLDAIPLAIELAAARLRVLSVEQIVSKLGDRFCLLTGGARTLLPRQQTLRAAIDWSYDLLTEQERVLLRRLSVFANGWTLSAAEGVCAGGVIEQSEMLDLLTRLVDRSLVLADGQAPEARYRMLETIKEYALECLRAAGESEEVQRRHAEYFLVQAEEAEPERWSMQVAEWLGRLEEEHDNLRTALGWLLEHDAHAHLRLATAIHNFWGLRGHLAEGRRWLEAALERSSVAPAPVRAKALGACGFLARQQGDLAAARAYLEESSRISRATGDRLLICASSHGLGWFALEQGDLRTARAYLEESLAAGREIGNDRLVANSLMTLGEAARLQGQWAEARTLYEQALALFRQVGNQAAVSVTLGNLGAVACVQDDLPVAHSCYREVLALEQAMGSKEGIACAMDGLAAVAAKRTAWEHSARLAGASEALRETIGYELEAPDRQFRDHYLAEVRAALGEEAFAAALAQGRALTLEQAVEITLSDGEGKAVG
jgi:predicted ATPase/tRNA A-37 threonylcarbamoyl transferase component Bud32